MTRAQDQDDTAILFNVSCSAHFHVSEVPFQPHFESSIASRLYDLGLIESLTSSES